MEMVISPELSKSTPAQTDAPKVLQHPHFVGLAHLRSLLTHEDVVGSASRTDAILDMISVFLTGGSCRNAVQTFCRVRRECQEVCYLSLFRLRRWMESHVMVRVNHGDWQSLDLSFQDYRKVVQNYRRQFWEWQDSAGEESSVEVRFAWKSDSAATPLSHSVEAAAHP